VYALVTTLYALVTFADPGLATIALCAASAALACFALGSWRMIGACAPSRSLST